MAASPCPCKAAELHPHQVLQPKVGQATLPNLGPGSPGAALSPSPTGDESVSEKGGLGEPKQPGLEIEPFKFIPWCPTPVCPGPTCLTSLSTVSSSVKWGWWHLPPYCYCKKKKKNTCPFFLLGRKRQDKGLDLGTVQTCGPAGVSIHCDFRAPPSFQIFLGQRKFASVLSSSRNDLPMQGPRARGSHWLETHRSYIHDAFEPDHPKGVRVPHLWVITPRLMVQPEPAAGPCLPTRRPKICP